MSLQRLGRIETALKAGRIHQADAGRLDMGLDIRDKGLAESIVVFVGQQPEGQTAVPYLGGQFCCQRQIRGCAKANLLRQNRQGPRAVSVTD